MDDYLLAVDSVADLLARPEVAAAWESAQRAGRVDRSVGWPGTWPGRSVAIEAEPSHPAPIALDEHYRRARGSTPSTTTSASTSAPATSDAYRGPGYVLARVVAGLDAFLPVLSPHPTTAPCSVPWPATSRRLLTSG